MEQVAIEQALQAWGERYQFVEWEHRTESSEYGRECHVWCSRGRFGAVAIRFTDLLLRRGLQSRLIAELDTHQVGRMARQGRWHVNVLTTGHDVAISYREEAVVEPQPTHDAMAT